MTARRVHSFVKQHSTLSSNTHFTIAEPGHKQTSTKQVFNAREGVC